MQVNQLPLLLLNSYGNKKLFVPLTQPVRRRLCHAVAWQALRRSVSKNPFCLTVGQVCVKARNKIPILPTGRIPFNPKPTS